MKILRINFVVALTIAISILHSPVLGQVKSKSPKKDVSNPALPFDASVKTGKLPNGFSYYIRKNVEPKNRATIYLAMKAGSILENENQRGLAHFMEHMSFNGTKNFPKNALVNYLQKAGVRFGADLNAYTSFDETVYQLPIPTDSADVFKNGMQIMRDWAQDASLLTEEIEKERGVVLEEKRLGKGAQQRMQDKYLPLLFNNSRYANRLPIGTEEVLKNFKPETIKEFYKDWYRPNLQALIVVGDIDVADVEKQIIAKFSDLKNPAKPKERTKYTIPLIGENHFTSVTDKEFPVTVAQILIKHPGTTITTENDLRNSVIRSLFNRMMGARVSELSKQANPPFLNGGVSISGFLAGLDVATIFAVAKPGELEKGLKAALTEAERVKKFGFTQTELDRNKAAFMTGQESAYKEKDKTQSDNFVQEYVQHFLRGEASPGIDFEYNFYKKVIDGIKLDEINILAKNYLVATNRDVIIMAPEKDKDKLPAEATVNKWIAEVTGSSIAAYKDDVSDKPLITAKPAAGKIVNEKKIEEIGVTELQFSNGVKVVLKPTDFKNDEINFSAFSPGGTSLYSDADFQSALYSSGIIGRSGVGEFNALQLPKLLTGKRAFVSTSIAERTENVFGFSTPKDLETTLQLVHLYFTAPRKDTSIFTGFMTQQKASLANRENDPNTVFQDSVSAVLGSYNLRRTAPSLEKMEKINLDRAYEIYKERFADAGDFTFTFVGNFNLDSIKPLLAQYIGSLPSKQRVEEAKNLKITPPAGKVIKEFYKGVEPKSNVRLVFTGEHKYNTENNNQLDALAEILNIKLIERLREDEGGVYGVRAGASYSKFPTERYTMSVSFGCAPENVKKLIASTLDEIGKIKKDGAQLVDVEKFVAEETRTTETQLKDNSFWLGYLSGQYQNQEDPKEVLGYLSSLKKVTPATLKAAANKYLSGENYIELVLMPEKK